MKISAERLLKEIALLGEGELREFSILSRLGISHGTFCTLRKELINSNRLEVTHPNRKAFYRVLEEEELSA